MFNCDLFSIIKTKKKIKRKKSNKIIKTENDNSECCHFQTEKKNQNSKKKKKLDHSELEVVFFSITADLRFCKTRT